MITCAQLGRGFAALGRFTCPHCRAQSVVAAGAPTPALLDRLARTMVLEMTQGAESTAGSYADYVRLAEEYVVSGGMEAAGGRLIMPHDSLEACKDFCSCLGRDKEPGRTDPGKLAAKSPPPTQWPAPLHTMTHTTTHTRRAYLETHSVTPVADEPSVRSDICLDG
jgi:hypothetical protein